ncbi:hypothetical protein INT47_011045 [Mucor saturninus]|uniref:SH3 domain-containing protein n=1 Tax=Mucor saturninus TaxID=64648 RepID=A0A8H7REI2_9FUNG|nr:hypothetical protein INT47_011045 [Mucor saturninus]
MDDSHYNLSSPTILVTSALTAASWLILFIGACVAQFHGVPWWIIIFELVFVVGTIVLLGLNKFYHFKHMIYLLMSVSLVYLTWLVQYTLDNDGDPGARAAAAGSCMLIIVQFIWAICLTSPAGSWFSRNGAQNFKNSSVGVTGANLTRKFSNTVRNTTSNNRKTPNSPLPPRRDEEFGSPNGNTDFEQAVALHDYQGSAEDPNELSFSKNERLEILDKRGNWWQARKQDGSTGIVPSNYVS